MDKVEVMRDAAGTTAALADVDVRQSEEEVHRLRNVLGIAMLEACVLRRTVHNEDSKHSAEKIIASLKAASSIISLLSEQLVPPEAVTGPGARGTHE